MEALRAEQASQAGPGHFCCSTLSPREFVACSFFALLFEKVSLQTRWQQLVVCKRHSGRTEIQNPETEEARLSKVDVTCGPRWSQVQRSTRLALARCRRIYNVALPCRRGPNWAPSLPARDPQACSLRRVHNYVDPIKYHTINLVVAS